MKESERIDTLKSLLKERVLVIDGAMGTSIQAQDLGPQDFGGEEYEGCNEYLVLTRPEAIAKIHQAYLDAGADILETDTFGATSVVLAEYNLAHEARRINREATKLARSLADAASTEEKPRFVAGSMGPTTKTISVTGGITFDELAESYQEQAAGLMEGGADVLLLETSQDTLNVKAGLEGIDRAFAELGRLVPVAVQGHDRAHGDAARGPGRRGLLHLAGPPGPAVGGLQLRHRARVHDGPRAHAGLPLPLRRGLRAQRGPARRERQLQRDPEMIASTLGRFLESGWVNLVGGCCGTGPEHVRLLAQAAAGKAPRQPDEPPATRVSGIEALVIDDEIRPAIVGERPTCWAAAVSAGSSAMGTSRRHPRSDGARCAAAPTYWTSAFRTPTVTSWPT